MSKLDADQIHYLKTVLGIESALLPRVLEVPATEILGPLPPEAPSAPDTGAFEAAFEEGVVGISEFRTSGDQNAAKVLLLIASESSSFPLEGEQGELARKMIAAMKYPSSHLFIIEWTHARLGNAPQGVRDLLEIDPKPMLIFGTTTASSLVGHVPSFGQWTSWEGTRLVVTEHPKELLLEPDKKRLAWAHMQTFMKGLS